MKSAAIIVSFDHWHNDIPKDGSWAREFAHNLQRCNPEMKVLVIDNASRIPYISKELDIIHLKERCGYGEALNHGLMHLQVQGGFDWYITLNNDCQIKTGTKGDVMSKLEKLSPTVLYGSGENRDTTLPFSWQYSAWMCISQKIFKDVGYFDERLSAAFEDFDYQRRAMDLDYGLDFADLPIEHLDMHTRYEDNHYPARWEAARQLFQAKHNLEMQKWFEVK
jgi:GT2 family glycosyltransferase